MQDVRLCEALAGSPVRDGAAAAAALAPLLPALLPQEVAEVAEAAAAARQPTPAVADFLLSVASRCVRHSMKSYRLKALRHHTHLTEGKSASRLAPVLHFG